MINEVHVELFRFDSKTDYLPYYKKYTIGYTSEDTVLDLLNKIERIEKFTYINSANFNLKINDMYVSAKESVSDILGEGSNELKIEPLSIYRALCDLVIDKSDYIGKILYFKEYLTPLEVQKYMDELELDYYASNTYDINRDYIGDHALLIASDIIEKFPKLKQEVIEKISHKDNGIWYHTALRHRIYGYDLQKEHKIGALFSMLPKVVYSGIAAHANSIKKMDDVNISQYFEGFNIAEFEGVDKNSCVSFIKESKANYVKLSSSNDDLAPFSTIVDKEFSRKIAGNILLEAKDNDADFLIVRGKSDLMLFDGEQKNIERSVGREIKLPVITQEQFKMLLEGEKNIETLGFNRHKVKIEFL